MKKYSLLIIMMVFFVTGSFAQILKTSLEITVRDRLGNVVEDAEVQIYRTYDDYQEETNPVAEMQKTDKKGRVLFKNLDAKSYYVNVQKGTMNNHGEGEMVDTLVKNRKNRVTVIIQ